MKNFKISKKLTVAFGTIGGMLVLLIIFAVTGLNIIGKNFTSFYVGPYAVVTETMNQQRAIQAIGKSINYAFSLNDEEQTKQYVQEAKDEIKNMQTGVAFFRQYFKGDQGLIDEMESELQAGIEYKEQIFELALANENEKAKDIYFNSYLPHLLKASQSLNEIKADVEARAVSTYNQANRIRIIVLIIMCIIAAAAAGVTLYFAFYIIKSLVTPIRELEEAADSLKEGELDISIKYESKDELGNLADAFGETCNFLKTVIQDLDYIINELAAGNFDIRSSNADNYKGAFRPILDQLRSMAVRLSDTMLDIREASNQVSAGSSQMADSAQSLAEGATDQAGAVEELTTTIIDVSNSAQESAVSANKVFLQAQGYEAEAKRGSDEMAELIASMQRINETSQQIGNIISDIEDIASQTNLLSLNAAIEAARAGEAGKGFAVVAEQIRKLADDSGKSAVKTRELIENSISEINRGNENTEKTSEALEKVITGINQLAEAVKAASDVSKTQSETMKQVELGIEQISNVVQSNSAAAEETSATSEELSAQAVTLNELVAQFKLRE